MSCDSWLGAALLLPSSISTKAHCQPGAAVCSCFTLCMIDLTLFPWYVLILHAITWTCKVVFCFFFTELQSIRPAVNTYSFPTMLTIYSLHSHHETQKSHDLRCAKRATCRVRPVIEVKQNKSRCLHCAITWTVDLISVYSGMLIIVSLSCNVAHLQIKINTTQAKNKRAYHTDLSKPVL